MIIHEISLFSKEIEKIKRIKIIEKAINLVICKKIIKYDMMYLIVRHTRLLCVLQKREFITIKDRRKLFVLRRKLRCKRKKESVYMSLTQIQKLQLNKQVDRILHAPGNQPTGNREFDS